MKLKVLESILLGTLIGFLISTGLFIHIKYINAESYDELKIASERKDGKITFLNKKVDDLITENITLRSANQDLINKNLYGEFIKIYPGAQELDKMEIFQLFHEYMSRSYLYDCVPLDEDEYNPSKRYWGYMEKYRTADHLYKILGE